VRFPPYPNYKASGVEWLRDVPRHWDVKRLKFLLAAPLQYGANESAELDDPGLPRYVRITDINDDGNLRDDTFRSLPKDLALPYLLEEGDLLFARSGATSGKTFLYKSSWGVCSYAGYLIRARLKQTSAFPKYVKYFTVTTNYWQWVSSAYIQATIQNVSAERYADLSLTVPPLAEQIAIADFLDAETTKLDTLVTKRQELIEKLKEKRTAIISRTVTRGLPPEAARAAGLNPSPKLKASGIEWLGDIPEHWDLKQLKWAITFQRGHDLPTDDREEGTVPVVTSSGVSATHSVAAAKGPGIVTGRYGTIGEFYLVQDDYWPLNTTLYSIHLRGNEPRFLRYMLTHLSPLFLLNAVKSAVPGVDRNDIHPTKAAVPPLPEQCPIADYLDREMAKIDRMAEKVEAAIERLQEYRTALITAAVTGKIDVRNVFHSYESPPDVEVSEEPRDRI
jgi:type I restriction enzyme S subunit